MKRKITLTVLVFLFSFNVFSQAPAIQWQKCYGGDSSDAALSIVQTNDGGYIFVGITESNNGDVNGNHGNTDCWVVKLDNAGIIQWQKCLGGTNDDRGNVIVQTSDGGYAIAGETTSNNGDVIGNHGNNDCWVVKLDNAGIIQWQKCLGGTNYDAAYSIIQTADGGYAITGNAGSNDGDVSGNHGLGDFWVVKMNNAGIIQWQKCFGGTSGDEPNSIIQTQDGGYVATGYTLSNDGDVTGNHGNFDAWVIKLDGAGSLQWQKCLGGTDWDGGYSIIQLTDGQYLMAGWVFSNDGDVVGNHGSDDRWIVKLNSTGVIQWQKCYGGSSDDIGQMIIRTSDGGFAVTGYTGSNDGDVNGNHGSDDYWVIKIDSIGTTQWQKCLGGTNQDEDVSIIYTSDGGYAIAGGVLSNDGDISGFHGVQDCWIVKLETDITGLEEENIFSAFNLSPNPATSAFTISDVRFTISNIEMYNVLGEKCLTVTHPQPPLSGASAFAQRGLRVDVSSLIPGVYFVRLASEKEQVTRKVVVQR